MEDKHFLKLAPRYIDQEATPQEAQAIETALLKDHHKQKLMKLLKQENHWIDQAFSHATSDISSILIGVRSRNPHRKFYFPPVLAFCLQLLLLSAFGFLILQFSDNITPPSLDIIRSEGKLLANKQALTHEIPLPFHTSIDTIQDSQAHLQIGSINDLYINQNTRFKISTPTPEIYYNLELEKGEIWARFIDENDSFAFSFPSLKGIEIKGKKAELNLIAGKTACKNLLPRNFDTKKDTSVYLILRLIEGEASLSLHNKAQSLERGKAYIIQGKKKELIPLQDSDHLHYSKLRFESKGHFKQNWNWRSPKMLPLSLEILPYPLWKELLAKVNRFEKEQKLLKVDALGKEALGLFRENTLQTLTDFKTKVLQSLSTDLQDWVQERDALLLSPSLETFDTALRALLQNPQDHSTLSSQELKILLSCMDNLFVILEDWKAEELTSTALIKSQNFENLIKVFANHENEKSAALSKATLLLKVIQENETKLEKSKLAYEALQNLQQERLNSDQRDPDGSKRLEIQKQLETLQEKILQCQGLGSEIDFLRLELAPLETQLETLNSKISPLRQKYQEASDQWEEVKNTLATNRYSQKTFIELEKESIELTSSLATLQNNYKELLEHTQEKRHELNEKNALLQDITSKLLSTRLTLDEKDAEIIATLSAITSGKNRLELTELQIVQLQTQLALLPLEKREESLLPKEIHKLEQTTQTIEKELLQHENKWTRLLEEASKLNTQLEHYENTRRDNEKLQAKLLSELEELQAKLSTADSELNDLQNRYALNQNFSLFLLEEAEKLRQLKLQTHMYEQSLPSLKEEITTLTSKQEKVESKALPKRERLENLLSEFSLIEKYEEEKNELELSFNEIQATEKQILRAQKQLLGEQTLLFNLLEDIAHYTASLHQIVAFSRENFFLSLQPELENFYESYEEFTATSSSDENNQTYLLLDELTLLGQSIQNSLLKEKDLLQSRISQELSNINAQRFAFRLLKEFAQKAAEKENVLLQEKMKLLWESYARLFGPELFPPGKPAPTQETKESQTLWEILQNNATSSSSPKPQTSLEDLLKLQWNIFFYGTALVSQELKEDASNNGFRSKQILQRARYLAFLDADSSQLKELHEKWKQALNSFKNKKTIQPQLPTPEEQS